MKSGVKVPFPQNVGLYAKKFGNTNAELLGVFWVFYVYFYKIFWGKKQSYFIQFQLAL